MKRWTRNCLAAGAILTGSGLLLGVVGAAINDGAHWFGMDNYHNYSDTAHSYDEYETVSQEMSSSTSDVMNNAYLSINVGNITIQSGDSYSFETANVDKSRLDYTYEDGELIVNYFKNKMNHGSDQAEEFIITVPRGAKIDELYIEGGVGNAQIEDIEVGHFNITTGVGDITMRNTACDYFDLDGGVGNFFGENMTVGSDADITIGVGDVNFNGRIKADTIITGGVGSCNLVLHEAVPEDFNYNIEDGMATVKINGETYKTLLSDNDYYNNNAQYNMDISGGIGNVDIEFSQTPATTTEAAEQAESVDTVATAETAESVEQAEATTEQSNDSNGSEFTGYQSDFSSFAGKEPFTLTFKSKFEDFSGKYVVLDETLDSEVTRYIQCHLTDDTGTLVITLEKSDGTSEVLLSNVKGTARGSKNIVLPKGKNRIVVTTSNGSMIDAFELNLYLTAK